MNIPCKAENCKTEKLKLTAKHKTAKLQNRKLQNFTDLRDEPMNWKAKRRLTNITICKRLLYYKSLAEIDFKTLQNFDNQVSREFVQQTFKWESIAICFRQL